MPFNPYAKAAQLADLFGASEVAAAARVGDRTQRQIQQTGGRMGRATSGAIRKVAQATTFNAHPTRGAIAGRNTASLPGIRTPKGVIGQGFEIPELKGSKGEQLQAPYIGAIGLPSIRVHAMENGGVETSKKYFSIYTPFISQPDWNRVKRLMEKVRKRAQQLSRGRLNKKRLAQLNHPYGKGLYRPHSEGLTGKALRRRARRGLGRLTRLKGVSNLAVVNKQSGRFERSWYSGINLIRVGGAASGRAIGVNLYLINLSPEAHHLLGTFKMRAHGPFLTAMQLYKSELDRLWREITKRAWQVMVRRRAEARRRSQNVGAAVL